MMTLRTKRKLVQAWLIFAAGSFAHAEYDLCPEPPTRGACKGVTSYNNFREQVQAVGNEGQGNKILFCPFQVEKEPEDQPVFILNKTDVEIICLELSTGCTIKGEGSLLKLGGSHVKATIQGFTFEGATKGALSIDKDSTEFEQKICHTSFIENSNSQGGGAVKINKGASALIQGCTFTSNKSDRDGGGISNRGNAKVILSKFQTNSAESGGAIMTKLSSSIDLRNNEFTDNHARDEGPAVFIEAVNSVDSFEQNVFKDNQADVVGIGNCDGAFVEDTNECTVNDIIFAMAEDHSDEPTKHPSSSPTHMPTAGPTYPPMEKSISPPTTSPSSLPTMSPTSSPTSHPTSQPTKSPSTLKPSSLILSAASSPSAKPTRSPTSALTTPPTIGPSSSSELIFSDSSPELKFSGWSRNKVLGICEGDCDRDSHCAEGLVCFHRIDNEEVPGCAGESKDEADYCIPDPLLKSQTAPSSLPTLAPIGYRTVDGDSNDSFVSRATEAPTHSPTSYPTSHPTRYIPPSPQFAELTFYGWSRNRIHGICEGDCDRDSECAEGLICFHRTGKEEVPGCAGEGVGEADYCIHDPSLKPLMYTSSPTSAPTAEPTYFPTDADPMVPFENGNGATSSVHSSVCPSFPSPDQDCIEIRSYEHFREIVMDASSGDKLVFCDFEVDKTEDDKTTTIKSDDVQLICPTSTCTIVGGGSHINIQGSEVLIQGFTFKEATSIAVRVAKGADDREHKICDCVFTGNDSKRRGAALKIDDGTKVTVGNCKFEENSSGQQGGGIYNDGETRVVGSSFHFNQAQLGAAIFNAGDSYGSGKPSVLELKGNNFIGNVARARGPTVYLDEGSRLEVENDNMASGNVSVRYPEKFSCNGVYREISMSCSEF
mmetsp:Transcript_715/g.1459  ORF Transcript_715/g.1459 Transcript_715/m.1459 type:complete len:883 (-) Transcript_715:101-2749(-)